MALDSDEMTSADAARALGVSVRQVQRLADAGELTETGRVGGSLLLDTSSVHRLVQRGSQRGRAWSAETAWAALDLVNEGRTSRLNAAQRSRLRARLREIDVEEFVRLARRRAEVHRFRAGASELARLRNYVTLTGESAVNADRAIADHFGLVAGAVENVALDGYTPRALLDDYRGEFFLADDHGGNVTLHAVIDDTRGQRTAGLATIALDLAESLDPRQRAAGQRILGQKLGSL